MFQLHVLLENYKADGLEASALIYTYGSNNDSSSAPMRQLTETETGLYQPLSLKRATVVSLLGLLAITMLALAGKVPLMALPFIIIVVAASLISILFERWRYGRLGKPTIALQEATLFIALPNDSRGHQSVPLANLREIVVYGPIGRHYFRFIYGDGTFVEAAPIWSKSINEAAIGFLQRKLSSVTKVTVKEPQSFFSYVRGEGP